MKPNSSFAKVISISALDNFGASGLAADVRIGAHIGVHVFPVITAITVQNNELFYLSDAVDPSLLIRQLEVTLEGCENTPVRALKIGLLPDNPETIKELARYLKTWPGLKVLDTPFMSSSLVPMLSEESIAALADYLAPVVDIMTPNLAEAERLGRHFDQQLKGEVPALAAHLLKKMDIKWVVIKGCEEAIRSPDTERKAIDYLAGQGGCYWLESPHQPKDMRGTGCQFALAIAAHYALGHEIADAVVLAKTSINHAISTSQRLGSKHVSFFSRSEKHPGITSSAPPDKIAQSDTSSDTLVGGHYSFDQINPQNFPVAYYSRHPKFTFPEEEHIGLYAIAPDITWFEKFARAGIKFIQLRLKNMTGDEVERATLQALSLSRQHKVTFYLNDFWKLAIKHQIYGVHLGQEDLLTADLEAIANAGVRLGISTHCFLEAAVAKSITPSYYALGPIFPTTCKSMAFGPQGPKKISQWKQILQRPIVAIGGITRQNAPEIAAAGADGLALISDLTTATNFNQCVKEWLEVDKQFFS